MAFSEDDQRCILAEIIKSSQVGISLLVDFINVNSVEPCWEEMRTRDRTIKECKELVASLGVCPRRSSSSQYQSPPPPQAQMPPPQAPHQRAVHLQPPHHQQLLQQQQEYHSSPQKLSQHQQEYRSSPHPPYEAHGQPVALQPAAKRKLSPGAGEPAPKRASLALQEIHPPTTGRTLLPRPSPTSSVAATTSATTSTSLRTPPKRRGRPSKANKVSGQPGNPRPILAPKQDRHDALLSPPSADIPPIAHISTRDFSPRAIVDTNRTSPLSTAPPLRPVYGPTRCDVEEELDTNSSSRSRPDTKQKSKSMEEQTASTQGATLPQEKSNLASEGPALAGSRPSPLTETAGRLQSDVGAPTPLTAQV